MGRGWSGSDLQEFTAFYAVPQIAPLPYAGEYHIGYNMLKDGNTFRFEIQFLYPKNHAYLCFFVESPISLPILST